MKYALIDVGSNTIRLVIYETGQEGPQIILNDADFSGILSYVKNGVLSEDGFFHIVQILKKMKKTALDSGCGTLYAFATASLRDISDKAALAERIREASGVDVHIISGAEEARYDYLGLRSEFNAADGAAFDLGGGSCQLMYFERGRVMESDSRPIGSLRLYNAYVSGVLPTESERIRIRSKVRIQLSGFGLLYKSAFPEIYAMGGAARAALKVLNRISRKKSEVITRAELSDMLLLPEAVFRGIIPERITTIIPAVITILEILDFCGSDAIHVTDRGVRDGILYELMNRNKPE